MNDFEQDDQVEAQANTEKAFCKVRCITELRPWATVQGGDNVGLRPLELDEVVMVPANEGQLLQKNRHAIIVG